jgi:tight adherence protein C
MGPVLLVLAAVALAVAAARELAAVHGEEIGDAGRRLLSTATGGRASSLADAARRLRIPDRIERAGLEGRLRPAAILAAKLAGAALGALAASSVAPVAPGRLELILMIAFPAAGFLAPDALLERTARTRRDRLIAALPDALDLLAVGVATGRAPAPALAEISAITGGPLAEELARVVAEVECGATQLAAMSTLRERVDRPEIATLVAAIERSVRHGSPLAAQLSDQAASLRRDQRRAIEESAARAAPKIQLVVALILVPSVLLMIVAALIAHSDALLGGGFAV